MALQDGNSADTVQVLVEDRGSARILTLNRPRQLNALSSQMLSKLSKLFAMYENDTEVKLLILKGKGRAFCAGGNVPAVANSVNEGHWSHGAKFFQKEYILNYRIATYSKVQVSILNGIVMGAGAGVSVHGNFRVATENTVFAMPETALGLFPDIGASYFLSRLPGFLGEYVGLTGVRLDGAEMLACGLATHFVPSTKLPMLEELLLREGSSDTNVVSAIISGLSERASLKQTSAYNRLDIIDRCFSKGSVEDIISALEQEAINCRDGWIKAAMKSLKKASPSSLKISLKSIRQGRLQGIDQCLVREYRMVSHILRRDFSKDFFEGCRAILVDKDKNPKWEPSKLELVSENMVKKYFAKVDDPEWEDLKLPLRPNAFSTATSKL